MNARSLLAESDREQIRVKLCADREAYGRLLADVDQIDDRALVMTSREALADIDDALQRLDTTDYGYCETCGRWIAIARLLALPHTRYCVGCAAARSE